MTIPASGVIWGLMWATDRLYDWGFGLIAVPIRTIIFIIQKGNLCIPTYYCLPKRPAMRPGGYSVTPSNMATYPTWWPQD